MPPLIAFEHVALTAKGSTLAMGVGEGHSLAVMGPAASGKTRLLRIAAGLERAPRGKVVRNSEVSFVSVAELSKRTRPVNLARQGRGAKSPDLVAEVLSGLRLWNERNDLVGDLSDSQRAACALIPPLINSAPVLLIDGVLDLLDPWALRSTLSLLFKRASAGTGIVVATHRPDIALRMDALIVLRDQTLVYAGPPSAMLRGVTPARVVVSTDNQPGARALADPFEVTVEETADGVRYTAAEGQQLAARLLLEGYGDVRYVLVKHASLEEALIELGF